jgi:hypothetical protein
VASSLLDLILRMRKQGDAAAQARKELEGLEGQTKKSESASKGFNLAQVALITTLAAVAVQGIRIVDNLAQQGIAYQRAERAVVAYTGSQEASVETIEAVSEAASGLLSDFAAAQNSARLFSMGLATTAEEAAHLTEVAVTLGSAMGKDAQLAFEDFTLMLANQSILRLDTFGISGAKVRTIMADLMAETVGMTRETAFMNATLQIADERLAQLGEAGFEAGDGMQRAAAATDNFTKELGLALAPAIDKGKEAWAGFVGGIADAMAAERALKEAVDQGIITRWASNNLINRATYTSYTFAEALEFLAEREEVVKELSLEASHGVLEFRRQLRGAAQEAEPFAEAMDGVKESLQFGEVDLGIGRQFEKLREEADFLLGGGGVFQDIFNQAKEAFDAGNLVDAEEIARQGEIAFTGFQVAAGNMDVSEGVSKLEELGVPVENAAAVLDNMIAQFQSLDGQEVEAYINYVVTYDDQGGAGRPIGADPNPNAPGHALGDSWEIVGRPGRDQVPISFWGSPGERVTVEPRGAPVTNNNYNQRMLDGATIVVQNPMDMAMLEHMLKKALRG